MSNNKDVVTCVLLPGPGSNPDQQQLMTTASMQSKPLDDVGTRPERLENISQLMIMNQVDETVCMDHHFR
jgi:hypothetical protein